MSDVSLRPRKESSRRPSIGPLWRGCSQPFEATSERPRNTLSTIDDCIMYHIFPAHGLQYAPIGVAYLAQVLRKVRGQVMDSSIFHQPVCTCSIVAHVPRCSTISHSVIVHRHFCADGVMHCLLLHLPPNLLHYHVRSICSTHVSRLSRCRVACNFTNLNRARTSERNGAGWRASNAIGLGFRRTTSCRSASELLSMDSFHSSFVLPSTLVAKAGAAMGWAGLPPNSLYFVRSKDIHRAHTKSTWTYNKL